MHVHAPIGNAEPELDWPAEQRDGPEDDVHEEREAAPGVLLVLTGADAAADKLGAYTAAMMPEDIGAPKGHRTHLQVLQSDKVRFVGDRVAFVVAETEAQARDAADMVEV